MSHAIRVEGLIKDFPGGTRAVDGISLEVEKGSIFGFLGPNGAGKTTTINILCTLMKPTEGRAFINGLDCMLEPALVRKSIGLVFQDTTLDKDLTAYENLVFHAYLYSVRKSEIRPRVEDALHFVGLYDRRDEIVKRFVSLEFNNLLKYYRGAKDLSSHDKESGRRDERPSRRERGTRGERPSRRERGDRNDRPVIRYPNTHC